MNAHPVLLLPNGNTRMKRTVMWGLLRMQNPSSIGEREGYRKQTWLSCWDSFHCWSHTAGLIFISFNVIRLCFRPWDVAEHKRMTNISADVNVLFCANSTAAYNNPELITIVVLLNLTKINLRNTDAQCQKTSQVLWSCLEKLYKMIKDMSRSRSYFNPNQK